MTATLPVNWREDKQVALETLRTLRAARDARIPAPKWDTPGQLAKAVEPKTVQTRALDLIDAAIVRAYNTPDARLIISMPPQEGKSQRTTRFGSLWALTNNPDTRIVIMSYAVNLAETFSRDIRNWITQNNGADGTLDLRLRIAADNGAVGQWSLDGHKGGIRAVGLDGGINGHPADALIIDDPFANSAQADSPAHREKVWGWWQSTASTRLAPGAPVIVIMTRWHEDDLAGRLLAAPDGGDWEVLNIPALADFDPAKGETDPLGREPGQWLESSRGRTVKQWERIRIRSGARVFSALYQGRPSPESGNVWRRQDWRRYPAKLWSVRKDGRSYKVDCDEMIQSWDFTFKDTKSADFVVGQVWARKGADAYLIDQVRARMSFTDSVHAMQTLSAKWPQARLKLVEDKANGSAVIDTLNSRLGGIKAVNPEGSKQARANAVSPFIEAGNVHLPDKGVSDWFDPEAFIDEAAAFPNATHDDQVDAASQALARFFVTGSSASVWLAYLDRKIAGAQNPVTEAAAEITADEIAELEQLVASEPEPPTALPAPLTAAEILAAARNASYRERY